MPLKDPVARAAGQARRSKKWRDNHPIGRRLAYWRWKSGCAITYAEYAALGEDCFLQGVGACFNPSDRSLALDHDHVTHRVRGLLCHRHHAAITALGDGDPEMLQRVVDYLARD
jgi:hypothetical protein